MQGLHFESKRIGNIVTMLSYNGRPRARRQTAAQQYLTMQGMDSFSAQGDMQPGKQS